MVMKIVSGQLKKKIDGSDTSIRSKYHTTSTPFLLGQKVGFIWSVSVDWRIAISYISFLGLNDWELPKSKVPSDILAILIEELAVEGVNPDSKSVGFIVLVCCRTDIWKPIISSTIVIHWSKNMVKLLKKYSIRLYCRRHWFWVLCVQEINTMYHVDCHEQLMFLSTELLNKAQQVNVK